MPILACKEENTSTRYEADVVAWANEQAELIRTGQFDRLDIEHIADEIEDVGKSEQRELANRMAMLLAHLLRWQFQPERRGASWEVTIRAQRKLIYGALKDAPSLAPRLRDRTWIDRAWDAGLGIAASETGLACFPETCPWSMEAEVLREGWFPDA